MNCTWAEEHLSAYLDDALDPLLSRDVGAHIAGCARCQATLDDYRRFDLLLLEMPRIEPSAQLRDRIFADPEILALMGREALPSQPTATTRPDADMASEAAAHGGAPTPVPFRPAARRRSSLAAKVLLPLAAVLTLAVGVAAVARQGVMPSQQVRGGRMTTIAGVGADNAPLPAGTRLVYQRDGALWSAPEQGKDAPRQLTPDGVRVAGWSVAPLKSSAGARHVAYIDAATGRIHVIRADALGDRVLASTTMKAPAAKGFWDTASGQAVSASLAWSPDGTRLAYLSAASGSTTLHVINAAGSGDTSVNAGAGALTSPARWSNDSLYLGYTETRDGAQSMWAYNIATGQTRQLAAYGDTSATAATVATLAWTASDGLTWSARQGGVITGLFAAGIGDTPARRLTPAGARYTAAAYSQTGGWLLAAGRDLYQVQAADGQLTSAAKASGDVTRIVWSPLGTVAAVEGSGQLDLWSASGLSAVANSVVEGAPLAWSATGRSLAYVTASGDVVSAEVRQGKARGLVVLARASRVAGLVWSASGQVLAIESGAGIALVSAPDARVITSDARAASGAIQWSVAG